MELVHSVAVNQLAATKQSLTRAGVPAKQIGVRQNGAAHEIYVPEEYAAAAKNALSGHTYQGGGSNGKESKGSVLKGGPLGPALIVFAVAVSFVQPALGLTAGVLGVGGTLIMRKLADNEKSKIDAMHAAGLDWTIGQRVENFVTGGLVGGLVIFTIAGLILFALSVYGFDSIGILDGAIGVVESWRGGL